MTASRQHEAIKKTFIYVYCTKDPQCVTGTSDRVAKKPTNELKYSYIEIIYTAHQYNKAIHKETHTVSVKM